VQSGESGREIRVIGHGRRRPTIHEFYGLSGAATLARKKGGWVYILTDKPNGTLYVGVTSDLARRLEQHRSSAVDGFTKRYSLKRLVFAERHDDIAEAIRREKALKGWRRAWKVRLIREQNPDWADLADEIA
jgi:putative endonuclease